MKWTAIVVNNEGYFSHSFSFVAPHDKRAAFKVAEEQTSSQPRWVIAIVAGDHPVYSPSMDA